jgi:hypothetical protein
VSDKVCCGGSNLGLLAGKPKKRLKRPGARVELWWKGCRKQPPKPPFSATYPQVRRLELLNSRQTPVGQLGHSNRPANSPYLSTHFLALSTNLLRRCGGHIARHNYRDWGFAGFWRLVSLTRTLQADYGYLVSTSPGPPSLPSEPILATVPRLPKIVLKRHHFIIRRPIERSPASVSNRGQSTRHSCDFNVMHEFD